MIFKLVVTIISVIYASTLCGLADACRATAKLFDNCETRLLNEVVKLCEKHMKG